MSYLQMRGGTPLYGEIKIQGSKNAVLPMLAATLLCTEEVIIENCPKIEDVESMLILLKNLGIVYEWEENCLTINAKDIIITEISKKDTEMTRASILVLGAMLGRMKEVGIAYPGGCAIGKRPIDYHLEGFRKLKVDIEEKEEKLFCDGENMEGTTVTLPFPSVGATENIMLAAVLTKGETHIINAAIEPEIMELGNFLLKMGAKIEGLQTRHIKIVGVEKLHGSRYYLGSDRIVAGTYLAAVTVAKGEVTLIADCRNQLKAISSILKEVGADISYSNFGEREEKIHIKMEQRPKKIKKICTGVYPEFPTDMQSQFMAVLSVADGISIIEENIFENRFKTAEELKKMGAYIKIKGNQAYVTGREQLNGANVTAPDLRGGAALVIAGLAADGITKIKQIEYINRGYENYYQNLRKLGAHIEQVE